MFRLLSYRSSKANEGPAPDQADFSFDRYEPMARLLSDEDLLFLRAQPGFTAEMAKRFQRERRRIFRLYLKELAADFRRLHAHARAVVGALPAEHSPLVGMLLRQRARFWYEMTAIELRLSLNFVWSGSLQARSLVDALASMQAEIGRLAVATPA